MIIKDEVYPKVKADVRMTDDKTLWVKVSKPEFEKIGRIILEDGSIFCKVFYQDAEPKRKTGEWLYHGVSPTSCCYICSVCGEMQLDNSYFCPDCGADMRGDSE